MRASWPETATGKTGSSGNFEKNVMGHFRVVLALHAIAKGENFRVVAPLASEPFKMVLAIIGEAYS